MENSKCAESEEDSEVRLNVYGGVNVHRLQLHFRRAFYDEFNPQ